MHRPYQSATKTTVTWSEFDEKNDVIVWFTETRQSQCPLDSANAIMCNAWLFLQRAAIAIHYLSLPILAFRLFKAAEPKDWAVVFTLFSFGYISYLVLLYCLQNCVAMLRQSSTGSNPVVANRDLVAVRARRRYNQGHQQHGGGRAAATRSSDEWDGSSGSGQAPGAAPGDNSLPCHTTADNFQATLRLLEEPRSDHGASSSACHVASNSAVSKVRGDEGGPEENKPRARGGSPLSGHNEENESRNSANYPNQGTQARDEAGRYPPRRVDGSPVLSASRRRIDPVETARIPNPDTRREGPGFVPLVLAPEQHPPQRLGSAHGQPAPAPCQALGAVAPDDQGGSNGRLAQPRFPKPSIADVTGDECDDTELGSPEATFRPRRRGGNQVVVEVEGGTRY